MQSGSTLSRNQRASKGPFDPEHDCSASQGPLSLVKMTRVSFATFDLSSWSSTFPAIQSISSTASAKDAFGLSEENCFEAHWQEFCCGAQS